MPSVKNALKIEIALKLQEQKTHCRCNMETPDKGMKLKLPARWLWKGKLEG